TDPAATTDHAGRPDLAIRPPRGVTQAATPKASISLESRKSHPDTPAPGQPTCWVTACGESIQNLRYCTPCPVVPVGVIDTSLPRSAGVNVPAAACCQVVPFADVSTL